MQIKDPKYYTYKLVESSNEENELFISTFSNPLSYYSYIGKLVEVNAIIFGYKDGHFSVLIISLTEVNVE